MADDWGSWGAVPSAQTGSNGVGSGWDAPPPSHGQAAHEQQPSGEPTMMGKEAARTAYNEQQGPGSYAPPSSIVPPPPAATTSVTGAGQTNGWTPSRSFVHTGPLSELEQPTTTATGHQQQPASNGFPSASMNGNMSNAGSFSPRDGPSSIQQSAPLSPSVSGGWNTAPQSVGPGSGQTGQIQAQAEQRVPQPAPSFNGSSRPSHADGGHSRTTSGWITAAQVGGNSINGNVSNGSFQPPPGVQGSQNGYTAQQPSTAAVQSPPQGSFGGPAAEITSSQNGFQQTNGNLNGNTGVGWAASSAAAQPPPSFNSHSTHSNQQNGLPPAPSSNTGGGWNAPAPTSSAHGHAGTEHNIMNGSAPTSGSSGAAAPSTMQTEPASGQYGHSRSSSHGNANNNYNSTNGYGGGTSNGYAANGYGNGPGASFSGEKRGGPPVYAFGVPAEVRGYLIGTGGTNMQRITDETGIRVTRGRPKENGDPQDRDFLFFNDDNHPEEKVEEALLKVLKIVRSKINDWLPADGKAAEVARRLQEQGKLVDTRTQNSPYRQSSGYGYQNAGNGYQTTGQNGSGGSSYAGGQDRAGGWDNRQNDAGRDERPAEAGPFRSSASNVGGTGAWGGMPAPNFSDSRSTVSKTGTQHPAARDLSIDPSIQPNGQNAASSASAGAGGSGGWQVKAPSFTPRNEAGLLSPAQSPVDTMEPNRGASASRWASNTQSNGGMAPPSFNSSSSAAPEVPQDMLAPLAHEMMRLQAMMQSTRQFKLNHDLYAKMPPEAKQQLDVKLAEQEKQFNQLKVAYQRHTGQQENGSGGSSYGGGQDRAGGWNNRQNDAGRDERPGEAHIAGSSNVGGWTVGAGNAASAQQLPAEVPGAAPSEAGFRYSESVAGSNGHARNASITNAQDQRYRQPTQDSGFGGQTSEGSAMPAGQPAASGKAGGWTVSTNGQATQLNGDALKPLNEGVQSLNLNNAPPSGAGGWEAINGPAKPVDLPVPSYGQPQAPPNTSNGGWTAPAAHAPAGQPVLPAAPSDSAATGWTAPAPVRAGSPTSAYNAPPPTYRSPTPQAAPPAAPTQLASAGGGIGWGEPAPAPQADSGAAQGGWGAPAAAPVPRLSNGFSGPDSSARSYNDSIHPSDSVSNDNATTVGVGRREPAYGSAQPNGTASYNNGQPEPAAQGGWGMPPAKDISNGYPSNPAASGCGGGWGAPAGNGYSNAYSNNSNGNNGNSEAYNGSSYQSNNYNGNSNNYASGGGSYGGYNNRGPPTERRFANADGSWASGPNEIPLRQNRWIQRGNVRPGADVVRPAVPEHIPGSGW